MKKDKDLESHYRRRVKPLLAKARWVLRLTDYRKKPSPLFIIKERTGFESTRFSRTDNHNKPLLRDRGVIYGESQRRCLPIIRNIVSRISDPSGIQLELQRFFPRGSITFRGNLPIDEEAGAKICLIFKLQERLKEMDRVEVIARRVDRFTREEAEYWLSRITNFGPVANRWALIGLKIMIWGQSGDKAIYYMLEQLR